MNGNVGAGLSLIVATLILVPVIAMFSVIALRFVIEGVVALIAIAENTERTAENTGDDLALSLRRRVRARRTAPRAHGGPQHPTTAQSPARDLIRGRAAARERTSAPFACLLKWLSARTAPDSDSDTTRT